MAGPVRVRVVASRDRAAWLAGLIEATGSPPCRVETAGEGASLRAGDADLVLFAPEPGAPAGGRDAGPGGEPGGPPVLLVAAGPDALDTALGLGAADLLDADRLDAPGLGRALHLAVARRAREARLGRLAYYDGLTGLPNRRLFDERLERAVAFAKRRGRLAAVMIADLNGFKAVNDRLGHAAGDRLLVLMAGRLRSRLRETDTVARLGGDEFALLTEDLARPEHAALIAHKLMDTVIEPAPLGEERVRVTASLGVALFPADAADSAGLKRLADAAMYRAKAEGGNRCRFHNPELDRRARRGALLTSDLRRAVERGEIDLHFRPQIALGPGRIGVAAQPIWRHPERGIVAAERFLPLAEDHGLVEPLTDRLVDAACAAAAWRGPAFGRPHVALPPPSRRPAAWAWLGARLAAATDARALPPDCLEIELDEATLLADREAGERGRAALKAAGVRLALRGFGDGVMALGLLADGGIDTVKIGRDALLAEGDARAGRLIGGMIDIAKDLGLRVVAEEADAPGPFALARRRGCDAVETAATCPLLPPEACAAWLRRAAARV